MVKRVTVAVAQIAPALGDLERNLALHEKMAREALSRGADLLIFPELSLTGYFIKDLVPSVALTGAHPHLARLLSLSREIALVVGAVEESADHRFFNTAFYLEGGEIRHTHRKVYLPTYGIFDEHRYLAGGDAIQVHEAACGKIALLICEDMWHPSAAYLAALQGADILICPSASPGRGLNSTGRFANAVAWETITRAYAQLFTCYVLYANRVGYEDGACFWGGSEVIAPSGRPVATAEYLTETLLVASLEDAELRRARIANPLLRDEKPDLTLRELQRILGRPEKG